MAGLLAVRCSPYERTRDSAGAGGAVNPNRCSFTLVLVVIGAIVLWHRGGYTLNVFVYKYVLYENLHEIKPTLVCTFFVHVERTKMGTFAYI